MKHYLLTLLAVVPMSPAMAEFGLSTGFDYSQGKYGTNVTTTQTALPVTVKYLNDRWTAKLSVPYLWIQNVNPGAIGETLPCGTATATDRNVNGLGDVVAFGSYSVVSGSDWNVGVGGKVKFATGDQNKCLSSGKNDYSAQTDVSHRLEQWTLFATLGYTVKGDPNVQGQTVNYRNPFYGSLGAIYKASPSSSYGASYDYRQKITAGGAPISELITFFTYRLNGQLKVQPYLSKGFSRNSPDFGVGAMLISNF